MSSIFPIRETVSLDRQGEPRLIDLDEETADEVFEALSSRTTRKIFLELHTQPQTASDLADVTDTSVQNVQYHLEKLTDADLVEVVDTWYSERGSEMKVYAPEDESLVLFAGRDKQSSLRKLLNRVVGIFAILLPPSVLVGWITNYTTETQSDPAATGNETFSMREQSDTVEGEDAHTTTSGDGGGGNGADQKEADDGAAQADTPQDSPEPETATDTPHETPDSALTDGGETPTPEFELGEGLNVTATPDAPMDAANTTAETVAGLDPAIAAALAFFVGGLFVFAILSVRSPSV